MKAVRLVEIGKPLEEQDIPVPTIGPWDVLVRVAAAGICHSDVHYRAGISRAGPLPLTLGHEVAGTIVATGPAVRHVSVGERVCLHYMVTCGECEFCTRGHEQFCVRGQMIGKDRDGGYAEFISVPARCAVPLPSTIPFEQGAVAMCSSATAYHALRKASLQPGERVAIFGVGGLGMSAVQLARAFGALEVYAIDVDSGRLEIAATYGAEPIHNLEEDAVEIIRRRTKGRGVDVALELIGLPAVIRQAIQSAAVFGRVVVVGLSDRMVEVDPYRELIGRELQLIGSSDHLAAELPVLIRFIERGFLDLSHVVSRTIPLNAPEINATMDQLQEYRAGAVRTVIVPAGAG